MITAGFTRKKTSVIQRTEINPYISAEETTEIKSREKNNFEASWMQAGENVSGTSGTFSSLKYKVKEENVYEHVP